MSGFHYAMLTVGGREVGGIGRHTEATPAGTPAAWSTYFAVENTDAAALLDCRAPEAHYFATRQLGRAQVFPDPVIAAKEDWDNGSALGLGVGRE